MADTGVAEPEVALEAMLPAASSSEAVDLAQRRSQAEDRLTELRIKRGRRLADGAEVAPINKRIAVAERELDALDDLGGELTRRRRAAEARAAEERRQALIETIGLADAERIEAVAACEKAARDFAEGLAKLHASCATLTTAIGGLTGREHVPPLAPLEVERRVTIAWAHTVKPSARATGQRIGALSYEGWPTRGTGDWVESEDRLVRRTIDHGLRASTTPSDLARETAPEAKPGDTRSNKEKPA